jgi:fatty-acyl-CoA synthase
MQVPLTIRDFLDRAAEVYGPRPAVVDEPGTPGSLGTITYTELEARARGMALALEHLGVAQGERVAIVSPNASRFMTSFFGVSGYGRVLVPVNYRLNADEVQYIIDHSGATLMLVDPEIDESLSAVSAKERILLDGVADRELFEPAPAGRFPADWDADENASVSINYTSGTTARPKGVQLTHRNCWLNASIFGWHTTVTDRDTFLHTLPMFHCNGWGMPYAVTAMGCLQVVQRKVDGEQILSRIDSHGVTLMCGAPAVVAAILDAATARRERGEEIPGRDRVRIVVAGAPPPSKTIERIENDLGWELIQIYGLTETSPLLTINRRKREWADDASGVVAQKLVRAGAPAMGIRLSISDAGEVLARGNVVLQGYWQQPEATEDALLGGWFHTGDGGSIDDEGYLTISDRKKDVIITGGENVSSIEVEDCIYACEGIAECAVIGVPDEKWGETIKAIVVRSPGSEIDQAGVIAHCKKHIAGYKAPTSVDFVDSIPRTATGKVQKFRLREPYWSDLDRQIN